MLCNRSGQTAAHAGLRRTGWRSPRWTPAPNSSCRRISTYSTPHRPGTLGRSLRGPGTSDRASLVCCIKDPNSAFSVRYTIVALKAGYGLPSAYVFNSSNVWLSYNHVENALLIIICWGYLLGTSLCSFYFKRWQENVSVVSDKPKSLVAFTRQK